MEKVTCKIKIEDLDGVGKGEFVAKASETCVAREVGLALALFFVLRTLDPEIAHGRKSVFQALAKVVSDLSEDPVDLFDDKIESFIQAANEVCLARPQPT